MSIRKSLAFSFLDRYASLVLNIASSMFVARLLTPAEIGVFSVTMVLLTFASTVRDLGAGQYLVQEKNLTTERIRSVWAVQLGLGLALAVIVLLASVPAALFYNEPRMRDVMLVIALSYAINPFGSLTYAWLSREMRFDAIALMRFCATLAGAVVSVLLAWKDFGPISLAYGTLATTIVNALISQVFRPKSFPWLPSTAEVKRVLAFGSQLTTTSFLQTLIGSAPELLLGKLQSMAAAGLFSRANGLLQMFSRLVIDAIYSLCLSWFSKESREQGGFAQPFLKATAYISALGWSFCLGAIFLAQPVIRLLYGPQWDASVELTRLIAVAMMFNITSVLCGPALVASGAVTDVLVTTIYTGVIYISLVAAGSVFGLEILGGTLIFAALVSASLWLHRTRRHVGFAWRDFFATLMRSGIVALASAVGPALALALFGPYPEQPLPSLLVGIPLSGLGFLAAILASGHPLSSELKLAWEKLARRRVKPQTQPPGQ